MIVDLPSFGITVATAEAHINKHYINRQAVTQLQTKGSIKTIDFVRRTAELCPVTYFFRHNVSGIRIWAKVKAFGSARFFHRVKRVAYRNMRAVVDVRFALALKNISGYTNNVRKEIASVYLY